MNTIIIRRSVVGFAISLDPTYMLHRESAEAVISMLRFMLTRNTWYPLLKPRL